MDKRALCRAFCDEVEINAVPAGLAVKTPFALPSGDAIGFYIVRDPKSPDMWRFEDSGMTVPELEANGVNLESGPRREALARLLAEYDSEYDEESREIHSEFYREENIPGAASRFTALLLRMQDFELMHADVVANTFRSDAEEAIRKRFTNVAKVEFRARLSDAWDNYLADAIIHTDSKDRPAVVVFFATSEARVDESVLMHWELRSKGQQNPIALVLESVKPPGISTRALRRAHNRLDALPVFRGAVDEAMEKLASQVGLSNA
jgi:hypothetical protein